VRATSIIRATIAGVVTSLFSFSAQAASAKLNETPESFVHRVYALYKTSDNSTGVDRTRPAGTAFYASSMLDAFARDEALLHGKEGVIDADPLCECQAWENLQATSIALTKGKAATVKARVVIENFVGAQRVVTIVVLTLLQTPAGWRIADVGGKHRVSVMAALRNEINEMEQAARPGGVPRKPNP
jgi:hypothetical protein